MSGYIYTEDLVKRKSPPYEIGIVLRTWRDDGPIVDNPAASAAGILNRGDFFASCVPTPSYSPTTIPEPRAPFSNAFIGKESDFEVIDRTMHLGDAVKRNFTGDEGSSLKAVETGIIVETEVKCRVVHSITGEEVQGWVEVGGEKDEVEMGSSATVGQFVVYGDWFGQIIEVFEEAYILRGNGGLMILAEMQGRLAVGDKGAHIIPSGALQDESEASHPNDVVVHIHQTAVAVAWLVVNQMISAEQMTSIEKPKKFWGGSDLYQLLAIGRPPVYVPQVESRVRIRNRADLPFKSVPQIRPDFKVQMFTVKETQTNVSVLWQDGTTERCRARDLLHHAVAESWECWPGDHVLWKGEDEPQPVIIESLDAKQRIAQVRLHLTKQKQLVSVLELDASGSADDQGLTEGLGVNAGSIVFLHPEGTTNGLPEPQVPAIGDDPMQHEGFAVDDEGRLTGWRYDFVEFARQISQQTLQFATTHLARPEEMIRPRQDYTGPPIRWLGVVSQLGLDGGISVTFLDGSNTVVPLCRLSKLAEMEPAFEHDHGDDDDDDDDEMEDMDIDSEDESMPTVPGGWILEDVEQVDMEVNDDDTAPSHSIPDSSIYPIVLPSGRSMYTPPAQPTVTSVSMDLLTSFIASSQANGRNFGQNKKENQLRRQQQAAQAEKEMEESEDKTPQPELNDLELMQRFDILSSVPPDHAFISQPPPQPSKPFTSRLQKEYRVLRTSLPDTILVRAYEDRTDLLRSLIFGPENTPYQNAPFVIDWSLGHDFPQSPPKAHFHSWTMGNGRVNPNLYEEGKVCLSILGTWDGDHAESWSPRSSLLQAFVSIQGLVLVKEPWYCEPGYEKQRGTREGDASSRQYNEKVYVLSQNFVRRAIEQPPGGLEQEIRQFYYGRKKLSAVIHFAEELMRRSTEDGDKADETTDAAVPKLTQGGIITLNRTLPKLRALLEAAPR